MGFPNKIDTTYGMKRFRLISSPISRLLGFALIAMLFGRDGHADERLWMDATINGREAHLAFDTGSSHLMLSAQAALRLGVAFTNAPDETRIGPEEIPVHVTEECDLMLGTNSFRINFAVLELPPMLDPLLDGVIGWEPASDNIFWIDATAGSVSCLSEVPNEVADWMKFNLQTNSTTLEFDVPHPGGKTTTVAVDTGSDGGVALSPDRWRDWKTGHANQPLTVDANYSPSFGLVVSEEGWARELAVGPLAITEVPVTEASMAEVALHPTNYQATLGLAALKRLDVIIDGTEGMIYLRARETPPAAYEHNRLGAVFVPVDLQSEDLIGQVLKGSPAWEAGIRSGDVLLQIDDLDVTEWRTNPAVLPLSRFWSRPSGTRLELTLRRGEEVRQAEVVLREILSPGEESSSSVTQE